MQNLKVVTFPGDIVFRKGGPNSPQWFRTGPLRSEKTKCRMVICIDEGKEETTQYEWDGKTFELLKGRTDDEAFHFSCYIDWVDDGTQWGRNISMGNRYAGYRETL